MLKVNEAFHDVDKDNYELQHPEIFAAEVDRWQRIGRTYVAPYAHPMRILDIGTGTGFVPMVLGSFLEPGDEIVCSDVSGGMLQVCRRNLEERDFRCHVGYRKLDGKKLDFKEPFDFVTMNSVAHHVADLRGFFAEVAKLVRPGGYMIIGHEPNRAFVANAFLAANFRFMKWLIEVWLPAMKHFALWFPRRLGVEAPVRRAFRAIVARRSEEPRLATDPHPSQGEVWSRVNRRLLEEGAIDGPLGRQEIAGMVDYHSPTATGEWRGDRGIDLRDLLRTALSTFRLEHFESYNHLWSITERNAGTRRYSGLLARLFPTQGGTFAAVLRRAQLTVRGNGMHGRAVLMRARDV